MHLRVIARHGLSPDFLVHDVVDDRLAVDLVAAVGEPAVAIECQQVVLQVVVDLARMAVRVVGLAMAAVYAIARRCVVRAAIDGAFEFAPARPGRSSMRCAC